MIRTSLSAGFLVLVVFVCTVPAELSDSINAPTEPAQAEPAPEEPALIKPVPEDPVLREPAQTKHRFPNVHLEASEDLLNAALGSNTITRGPFCEIIRGSRYRGMSTRDAHFSIRTLRAENAIALGLDLNATVNSNSCTTQQRTTVSSVSTTHINANKHAFYNDGGWLLEPSQASAKTRSRITGVSTSRFFGRRIAQRRARNAAYQQSGSVSYSVARRAEQRTRSEFDNTTQEMLASWENDLDHSFRQALIERGQLPQLVSKRSTDDRIVLAFLQAREDELGAVTELSNPLEQRQARDMVLSLHESALNNFADGMFAGRHFREDEVAQELEERLGRKLPGLEPDDLEKLWSIDFAEEEPLHFEFHNGIATVTLEARGFTVGDQQIPGARLRAAYELRTAEGKLLGMRQNRIAISPLGSENEVKKVGVRFQVFRSMLRRRFERVFPAEFTMKEFPTPMAWPSHATLHFATAAAEDEWLQLACDIPGKESVSSTEVVAQNLATMVAKTWNSLSGLMAPTEWKNSWESFSLVAQDSTNLP